MTSATPNTTNSNTSSVDPDVVDVESVDNAEVANDGDWAERAPLTSAFLRKFDAARNKLTEQLEAGQKNIDGLQKKALDLVGQVQQQAEKVGEKVSEQGKEAGTKLDDLRKNLGGKLPLRIDLESWLALPQQAREDVLTALGIASDRQVRELAELVDKMREENIVLVEAQTAVLKEIIELNAKKPAPARKAPARKAPARKTTAAKTTTAKKTTAAKSTTAAKKTTRKPRAAAKKTTATATGA